jgi:hypothetical protein
MDSSRIGLFFQGGAVVFLAAFAGCSSSSAPPVVAETTDGGCPVDPAVAAIMTEDNDAGAAAEPVVNGTGMACTPLTTFTTATKITVATTWPQALAINGCTAAAGCSAPFTIWLLTNYTVTGNTISASSKTCGNESPPVILNATGNLVTGVPAGMTGEVLNQFPLSVWTAPDMPVTVTTGTIGTWNVGSSISIDKSTNLIGLKATSALADPTMPWPGAASGLPQGDIVDSDDDGHPGITGIPANGNGFYYPHTAADPTTPQVTQLYIASRTTLSLYGVATSCTETEGRAFVSHLENHIIGCQEMDGTICTDGDPSMGSGFIDSNTTQFVPGAGTFKAKQIPAGSTCADVLNAWPATDGGCP